MAVVNITKRFKKFRHSQSSKNSHPELHVSQVDEVHAQLRKEKAKELMNKKWAVVHSSRFLMY